LSTLHVVSVVEVLMLLPARDSALSAQQEQQLARARGTCQRLGSLFVRFFRVTSHVEFAENTVFVKRAICHLEGK